MRDEDNYRDLYAPDLEHPDFPGLMNPETHPFFNDVKVPAC
jgi:hypothetical protein